MNKKAMKTSKAFRSTKVSGRSTSKTTKWECLSSLNTGSSSFQPMRFTSRLFTWGSRDSSFKTAMEISILRNISRQLKSWQKLWRKMPTFKWLIATKMVTFWVSTSSAKKQFRTYLRCQSGRFEHTESSLTMGLWFLFTLMRTTKPLTRA